MQSRWGDYFGYQAVMAEQMGRAKKVRLAFQVAYVAVLVVAIYFLVRSLNFGALEGLQLGYVDLFFALLIGLVYLFWSAFVFFLALGSPSALASKVSGFLAVLRVFGKTWMSRYFPVKGAWVVHRLSLARSLSMTKAQMGSSTVLELLTQFFGMAAIAAVFVVVRPESVREPGVLIIVLPLLGAMFFVLGSSKVLTKVIALLSIVRGIHPGAFTLPSFSLYLRVAGAQIITALLPGIATALIVMAVSGRQNLSALLFVIGVAAVANIVGVLAFFAPTGIGVKEGVYIFALQELMSLELAIVVALLARLLSIIADLVFFTLSQLPKTLRNQTAVD